MMKIPYKARVAISVGLFVWSIGAVIAAICFSQMGLLWTAYVGPILAFIAFIFSIIIMPKTNEDGKPIQTKKKEEKIYTYSPIWVDDDEEDEDEDDWDDEEEEEEERRRQEEEEEEERRREEEDEEEFMMYYEDDD